jgi:hypothetical protein
MWIFRESNVGGAEKFFSIILDMELLAFYRVNFSLVNHYKYSIEELENMLPYERVFYVTMLEQYIKEKNDEAERQRQQAQAQAHR